MSFLQPDRFFNRIASIDIQRDLLDAGLSNVLLDIDNTVRSRVDGEVPRDVGVWLGRARDAGVKFCLLSNNWHSGVHALAARLEMPMVAKACKPLPHGYLLAMRKLGATRKSTVAVGDQLLTDVIGAHLVGAKAFLVLPLAEADPKHTLLLRGVEHVLMGTREPEAAPAPTGVAVRGCEPAPAGAACDRMGE